MKKTQKSLPTEEQEESFHNHTLKEALEAKRLASQQHNLDAGGDVANNPPVKKTGKGRRALWVCVILAAAITAVLVTVWLAAPDWFYQILGMDPLKEGGVVMTIDKYEISRDEYLSYVVPAKQLLEETYGAEELANRDDLMTLVQQSVEESLFGRYTLLKWAEEYGITVESITDQELTQMRERIHSEDTSTAEIEDWKLRQELVIEKLSYALKNGEDPMLEVSDDQVTAYYRENGLYTVKHILLITSDYNSAMEKAESARKILTAALDGEPFDELVRLYSEDTEKENYLNGYICAPEEQDPAFEQAALSVKPGEIYADVVTATYGYHIIQRIEPTIETMHQQLDDAIVDARILEKCDELQSQMIVHYAPGYENITFEDIDRAWAE